MEEAALSLQEIITQSDQAEQILSRIVIINCGTDQGVLSRGTTAINKKAISIFLTFLCIEAMSFWLTAFCDFFFCRTLGCTLWVFSISHRAM